MKTDERQSRRRTALAATVLGLLSAQASLAEQLFVIDRLVLSAYADPDQQSERIATLQTGDAVDALERTDNFVRARLPDGREGWIGASYLSADPPAAVRLSQLQAGPGGSDGALKSAQAELSKLHKQHAALVEEKKSLEARLAAAEKSMAATSATIANEPPAPPPVTPAAPAEVHRWIWWSWPLSCVVLAGGAFALGYQTLGRRIQRKFGGVKIY
jgi:SH3 domain protein